MFGRSPLEQVFYNAMLAGKVLCDFFVYSAQWNTIAASGTASRNTPVNSDSDFVIQEFNLNVDSEAFAVQANPSMRLTLVDAGSGRQLMDSSIHISLITGQNRNSGSRPYSLPMPKLIRGSSVISATLVNNIATAFVVDLAYVGFKVFYQGNNNRQNILGNLYS